MVRKKTVRLAAMKATVEKKGLAKKRVSAEEALAKRKKLAEEALAEKKSAVGKKSTKKTAVEKTSAKKSAVGKKLTEKSAAEVKLTEKTTTKKTSAKKNAVEVKLPEKTSAKKNAVEVKLTEKTSTKKSAAGVKLPEKKSTKKTAVEETSSKRKLTEKKSTKRKLPEKTNIKKTNTRKTSDKPIDSTTDMEMIDESDSVTVIRENSIEEPADKTTVEIDPRADMDISAPIVKHKRKLRSLNARERKKLEKLAKEDLAIHSLHPEVKSAENRMVKDVIEFNIDYTPIPFLKTELMEHQFYGISWMKAREVENRKKIDMRGGILADEMGLGKTLQMIGLMLKGIPGELNLVIVPSVALPQWITELEKHAPGAFNIVAHHGRNKIDNCEMAIDASRFNVILTTYGTVENSYRKGKSMLHGYKYARVVIDEAHTIKDNHTSTSRAVGSLKADFRWGLTGTPVQNRVNDLLSLVRFLKIDPMAYYFCRKCDCRSVNWLNAVEGQDPRKLRWCTCGHFSSNHFLWWNRYIASPIRELGYTDMNSVIFDRLQKFTRHFILRRTKTELEASLGLPSKVVIVKRCVFSPQELEFYTNLYSDTKMKYNAYAVGGPQNNYAHIFELLQKMRMAVNHPFLACRNQEEDVPICGFCNEPAEDPVRSKCGHVFCRGEAEIFLQDTNKCPVCHVPITIDLTAESEIKARNLISIDNWQSSTKIETLVEMLSAMRKEGRVSKSIVFSQFVNFLEILRWRLERAGFRCVKIYGSMSMSQRKAAIAEFNANPDITVFLISLKAGGVALNLTEAENVFIMDLWWNPAVEEQAMDRIHRIGQFRAIRIYRIIIEDSIESRVLLLQKKKKALFETSVDNNTDALQRLTEEDLKFLFC